VRNTHLSKQQKKVDKNLLTLVIVLVVGGLIAVADASAPEALSIFHDKFYFFKQQFLWAIFGVVVMFVVSLINYKFWSKVATPLFIVSFILLIIVLFPGIGQKTLGARRWIPLGFFNIQPSEIIKMTLAIFFAKLAEKNKGSLFFFIPLGLVFGLIMLEPDLGTGLIVITLGMSQIFVAGVNLLHLLGAGVFGGIASLALILLSSYRRQRLLTFIQKSQDPLGHDYHIRQILLALGSGGLFGVGLGQSRQKYLFIPQASTDSIFAVIAEEIGFLGAMAIISIFCLFILKGLKIAKNAPDPFSRVLATGICAWIGIQVILNIGSAVALLPLTGIPLPFFSYGGSSLVMLLLGVGILLNISKYAKNE
jgi:cell division protein FtsW